MSGANTPTPTKRLDVRLMGATVRVPANVVYRPFPAETVVLNLDTGTYHGLNNTGGRMLELLDQLGEVKQVAGVLQAEFDQPMPQDPGRPLPVLPGPARGEGRSSSSRSSSCRAAQAAVATAWP